MFEEGEDIGESSEGESSGEEEEQENPFEFPAAVLSSPPRPSPLQQAITEEQKLQQELARMQGEIGTLAVRFPEYPHGASLTTLRMDDYGVEQLCLLATIMTPFKTVKGQMGEGDRKLRRVKFVPFARDSLAPVRHYTDTEEYVTDLMHYDAHVNISCVEGAHFVIDSYVKHGVEREVYTLHMSQSDMCITVDPRQLDVKYSIERDANSSCQTLSPGTFSGGFMYNETQLRIREAQALGQHQYKNVKTTLHDLLKTFKEPQKSRRSVSPLYLYANVILYILNDLLLLHEHDDFLAEMDGQKERSLEPFCTNVLQQLVTPRLDLIKTIEYLERNDVVVPKVNGVVLPQACLQWTLPEPNPIPMYKKPKWLQIRVEEDFNGYFVYVDAQINKYKGLMQSPEVAKSALLLGSVKDSLWSYTREKEEIEKGTTKPDYESYYCMTEEQDLAHDAYRKLVVEYLRKSGTYQQLLKDVQFASALEEEQKRTEAERAKKQREEEARKQEEERQKQAQATAAAKAQQHALPFEVPPEFLGMMDLVREIHKEYTRSNVYNMPGWETRDNPGDGNCYYYALADAFNSLTFMGRRDWTHKEIRVKNTGKANYGEWNTEADVINIVLAYDIVLAFVFAQREAEKARYKYSERNTTGVGLPVREWDNAASTTKEKPLVRIMFTGNHYVAVVKEPPGKEPQGRTIEGFGSGTAVDWNFPRATRDVNDKFLLPPWYIEQLRKYRQLQGGGVGGDGGRGGSGMGRASSSSSSTSGRGATTRGGGGTAVRGRGSERGGAARGSGRASGGRGEVPPAVSRPTQPPPPPMQPPEQPAQLPPPQPPTTEPGLRKPPSPPAARRKRMAPPRTAVSGEEEEEELEEGEFEGEEGDEPESVTGPQQPSVKRVKRIAASEAAKRRRKGGIQRGGGGGGGVIEAGRGSLLMPSETGSESFRMGPPGLQQRGYPTPPSVPVQMDIIPIKYSDAAVLRWTRFMNELEQYQKTPMPDPAFSKKVRELYIGMSDSQQIQDEKGWTVRQMTDAGNNWSLYAAVAFQLNAINWLEKNNWTKYDIAYVCSGNSTKNEFRDQDLWMLSLRLGITLAVTFTVSYPSWKNDAKHISRPAGHWFYYMCWENNGGTLEARRYVRERLTPEFQPVIRLVRNASTFGAVVSYPEWYKYVTGFECNPPWNDFRALGVLRPADYPPLQQPPYYSVRVWISSKEALDVQRQLNEPYNNDLTQEYSLGNIMLEPARYKLLQQAYPEQYNQLRQSTRDAVDQWNAMIVIRKKPMLDRMGDAEVYADMEQLYVASQARTIEAANDINKLVEQQKERQTAEEAERQKQLEEQARQLAEQHHSQELARLQQPSPQMQTGMMEQSMGVEGTFTPTLFTPSLALYDPLDYPPLSPGYNPPNLTQQQMTDQRTRMIELQIEQLLPDVPSQPPGYTENLQREIGQSREMIEQQRVENLQLQPSTVLEGGGLAPPSSSSAAPPSSGRSASDVFAGMGSIGQDIANAVPSLLADPNLIIPDISELTYPGALLSVEELASGMMNEPQWQQPAEVSADVLRAQELQEQNRLLLEQLTQAQPELYAPPSVLNPMLFGEMEPTEEQRQQALQNMVLEYAQQRQRVALGQMVAPSLPSAPVVESLPLLPPAASSFEIGGGEGGGGGGGQPGGQPGGEPGGEPGGFGGGMIPGVGRGRGGGGGPGGDGGGGGGGGGDGGGGRRGEEPPRAFGERRIKDDSYPVRREWTLPRVILYPRCMVSSSDAPACKGGYHDIPWRKNVQGEAECDFRLIHVPSTYVGLRTPEFKDKYREYRKRSDNIQIIAQLARARVRFASGASQISQYSIFAVTRHFFPFAGYLKRYQLMPVPGEEERLAQAAAESRPAEPSDAFVFTDLANWNEDLVPTDNRIKRLLVNPTKVVFKDNLNEAMLRFGVGVFPVQRTPMGIAALNKMLRMWYLPYMCYYESMQDDYVNHTLVPEDAPTRKLRSITFNNTHRNTPLLLTNISVKRVLTESKHVTNAENEMYYTPDDVFQINNLNFYCNTPFYRVDNTKSIGVSPNYEYINSGFAEVDSFINQSAQGRGLVKAGVNHLKTATWLYYTKMQSLYYFLAGASDMKEPDRVPHVDPSSFPRDLVVRAMNGEQVSFITKFEHVMMCNILISCVKEMNGFMRLDTPLEVDLAKKPMLQPRNLTFTYVVLAEALLQYNDHFDKIPKRERISMRKMLYNEEEMYTMFVRRLTDVLNVMRFYMMYSHRYSKKPADFDERMKEVDRLVHVTGISEVTYMDQRQRVNIDVHATVDQYNAMIAAIRNTGNQSMMTSNRLMAIPIEIGTPLSVMKNKLVMNVGMNIHRVCDMMNTYFSQADFAVTEPNASGDSPFVIRLPLGEFDLTMQLINDLNGYIRAAEGLYTYITTLPEENVPHTSTLSDQYNIASPIQAIDDDEQANRLIAGRGQEASQAQAQHPSWYSDTYVLPTEYVQERRKQVELGDRYMEDEGEIEEEENQAQEAEQQHVPTGEEGGGGGGGGEEGAEGEEDVSVYFESLEDMLQFGHE